MFRLLLIALVAIPYSLFSTSVYSASYSLCEPNTKFLGKVFVLNEKITQKCWQVIKRGSTLNVNDIKIDTEDSIQFTYIFPDQKDNKFDRLFSVLVRELKEGDEETDPYIEILRDRFSTLCTRPSDGEFQEREWKKFYAQFPGFKYNSFHNASSVTRRKLANFHVAFVNAQKTCVRTDEEGQRRESFIFNDTKFPDVPEIKEFTAILKLIAPSVLNAFEVQPSYRKYRVRIRKGSVSETGMLSANFYISADKNSDIKLQNLSDQKKGLRSLLSAFKFKIRK